MERDVNYFANGDSIILKMTRTQIHYPNLFSVLFVQWFLLNSFQVEKLFTSMIVVANDFTVKLLAFKLNLY